MQWFLLLILLLVFVAYLLGHRDLWLVVREINSGSIAVLAGISSLLLLSNGMILKVLLGTFSLNISLRDCFGISALTAMGSYMASFVGGTFGKALYLKKRHDFPYSAFLSSMSAAHIIDFFWISLLGCSVIMMTGGLSAVWGPALLAGFLLLGFSALVLLVFSLRFSVNCCEGKLFKAFADFMEGWRIIRRDRSLIGKISVLLLANQILTASELFVGYGAFSIKIGIAEVLLMGVITSISFVVKLTPANIGIQEGVIAFSSHLLGAGFDEGLLVAALLRVISLIVVFFFGGLFGVPIFRNKR